MTNLTDVVNYDTGVYEIQTTDPVQGGPGGIANMAAQNLANRTAYLKQQVALLEAGTLIPPGVAPLNSPGLTGSPTVPTAPVGDNSNAISDSAFAQRLKSGIVSVNVAGGVNVALTQAEWGYGIIELTGALTASIAVIFPTTGRWLVANQTTGAFTITCKTAAGTGVLMGQGQWGGVWGDGVNIDRQQTDYNGITAALTAGSTVPTAAPGTDTEQPASTAFVQLTAAGRLIGVQTFTTVGTATYTPTAGTNSVIVEVQGGGAAGAGSVLTGANGTSIGGPGSSGAYARSRYTSGFSGVTVTTGAGGLGVNGAGGNNGGASSFGALVSCPGGIGGSSSTAGSTPLAGGNGNQVLPTGANLVYSPGDNGTISTANDGSSSYGANGGRTPYGPGAAGPTVNANGQPSQTLGGGGSGTANYNNGASATTGGNGSSGYVRVWEYA